jgi:hypothetical protein
MNWTSAGLRQNKANFLATARVRLLLGPVAPNKANFLTG